MSKISTLKQELEQAIKEGRQPNCPYCGERLQVEQTHTEYLRWRWSSDKKRYVGEVFGDAREPQCMYCGTADENFLAFISEFRELCEKLGLDY